jgi:hypothetical protein
MTPYALYLDDVSIQIVPDFKGDNAVPLPFRWHPIFRETAEQVAATC